MFFSLLRTLFFPQMDHHQVSHLEHIQPPVLMSPLLLLLLAERYRLLRLYSQARLFQPSLPSSSEDTGFVSSFSNWFSSFEKRFDDLGLDSWWVFCFSFWIFKWISEPGLSGNLTNQDFDINYLPPTKDNDQGATTSLPNSATSSYQMDFSIYTRGTKRDAKAAAVNEVSQAFDKHLTVSNTTRSCRL